MFENPFEAFYWLGFHVGRKVPLVEGAAPPAKPDREREEAQCQPGPPKQALCEVADFCVFDTETSGLSSNAVAVQVAIGFFASDGRALGFYDRLWHLPNGVRISRGSYGVHKISHRRVEREGYPGRGELARVHRIFQSMKRRGKRVIAHNAQFDCRILKQSARQHGFDDWCLNRTDVFCTMTQAVGWCGLVSKKTGRAKRPSNAELYQHLTGQKPPGSLHDALVDIKVTAKSYVEGVKRGWW
jgi:DNA polymerase III epsilon subunit-like protein